MLRYGDALRQNLHVKMIVLLNFLLNQLIYTLSDDECHHKSENC